MNYTKQDLEMALAGCQELERRIRVMRSEHGFYEELAHDRERRERIAGDMAALVGKPRKRFSAATRRKMAASQRKRWAAMHQGLPATPKKRRLSAKGRAAIAEAQRKRWAAQKKGKAMGATA